LSGEGKKKSKKGGGRGKEVRQRGECITLGEISKQGAGEGDKVVGLGWQCRSLRRGGDLLVYLGGDIAYAKKEKKRVLGSSQHTDGISEGKKK